jgi:hypothetical protein
MGRGALAALAALALALGGCGGHARSDSAPPGVGAAQAPAALIRQARPIGHTPRFHPPATGPVIGACRPTLGLRRGVHIELFAANRVMLIAAGIGTRPPRRRAEGRIVAARCFGALVTLEPTGVVLVRARARLTLAAVFRSWGQPLTRTRLGPFRAAPGHAVEVYVGGRVYAGAPATVPLTPHSEIVLEVGPHVPPHSRYTFPPGA